MKYIIDNTNIAIITCINDLGQMNRLLHSIHVIMHLTNLWSIYIIYNFFQISSLDTEKKTHWHLRWNSKVPGMRK